MSKHKQEVVQRPGMSLLSRRDPDFVPNIYFNYILVPFELKLNVSTTFNVNITINFAFSFPKRISLNFISVLKP